MIPSPCFNFTGRIAAATHDTLPTAIKAPVSLVIVLDFDIELARDPVFRSQLGARPIFIHADLMKGVTADKSGLAFLKNEVGIAGIVSTKNSLVKVARQLGLGFIQRTFLIDSQSLQAALDAIERNPPDAIEFMPGIAYSVVPLLKARLSLPIIMAGLIHSENQVQAALAAGADAVSMSRPELWTPPN